MEISNHLKENISAARVLIIWAATNVMGTVLLPVHLFLAGGEWTNLPTVAGAGIIGALITIPVIPVLFPVLYTMAKIRSVGGRIVFIIVSMAAVTLVLAVFLTVVLDGKIKLKDLEKMLLLLFPWMLSSIACLLLAERNIAFRRGSG
jgi:hypothetical protein